MGWQDAPVVGGEKKPAWADAPVVGAPPVDRSRGAAAIPTAADEGLPAPGGALTLTNPQAIEAGARAERMRAAPPSFTDKIAGGVEAGLNLAAGIVGTVVGAPVGAGIAAAEATGLKTPTGPGGKPVKLDPAMAETGAGVTAALKRTFSGPMDLREEPEPESDVAADIGESVVQPAMEAGVPLMGLAHQPVGVKPVVRAAGDLYRAKGAPVARAATDAAGRGVGKAAAKTLGVDPELAKVAQLAGDLKHPIDVRPDQVVENAKFSKLAGQAAADVPLANSKTSSNQVAFTRNLIDMLNPEEAKADRLTPDVFDKAMRRSGEGIGEITARTPVPEGDLAPGLKGLGETLGKATEDNRRIVTAYVADIGRAAEEGGGKIDGTRLKEINSEIGKQARANVDNDLGRYLNDLQDVIQDSVERNATPTDITALRDFRRQYAYGKMVEPLVAKTIDGKISPQGLMARVTATKQGKHFMARSMGGPIGDLAKVGQLIKEPGTSLTTERSLVYGAGLGGGALIEPHTAAGAYGAALAYNTLGPKLTRAMVGKKPKPKEPPGPPPEPTTSPGAGGGGGGDPPPKPGPLGDLTPDWKTTPGAGGGKTKGGHEPGLVRPVDEPSPTTGNRKSKLEIPAVPGRPDLPDTLTTGGPAESAATARANKAMVEPGAIEARAQQAEAAQRRERAAEPKVPVGEVKEGQPEIKAKTEKVPVGKVIEGQPEIKPLVPKKPIKAGEATELPVERIEPEAPIETGEVVPLTPEQEKAWRKEFGLGDGDAERAKAVATALKHDAEAVEKAAVQLDNQPRAFDREIARITDEGEARANEVKQAADGGEGDAAKPDAAAAAPAAGERPGADSTAAAGAGGKQAPAGRQAADGAVEIREVPGGFEAYRGDKKVGYLKDNLERGQAKQLGENANVDMVKVDKDEQGKGTGRALYAAFEQKHEGAIAPSGKTEPSAWKLWKRNYPEKVDAFVKQEAARIADGADPGLVARNITDPEVRSRVLKESEDGQRQQLQPDDLQPAAKEEGVQKGGGAEPPEEVFSTSIEDQQKAVADYKAGKFGGKPVGSPERMREVLNDKFGAKLVDGLIEQGLLKFALSLDEGRTTEAGQRGVKAVFRPGDKAATLYFDRITEEHAPALLMHELGEHFGAPRMLGEQRYKLVMDELKGLAETDPEVKAAWKHVEDNYIGPGTPDNVKRGDDAFMREVAAHLVETQPDLPWVRRLVNEIRAFFYEHFGTTMGNRVDANLIRGLAAAALRRASTGGLVEPRPAARQFRPFVPSRPENRPPI